MSGWRGASAAAAAARGGGLVDELEQLALQLAERRRDVDSVDADIIVCDGLSRRERRCSHGMSTSKISWAPCRRSEIDAAYVRPDDAPSAAASRARREAAARRAPRPHFMPPSPRAAPPRLGRSPLRSPRHRAAGQEAALQNKTRIQIWLFENTELRIEGKIIGFDEYMNLVLDDAEELSLKQKTRKPRGARSAAGARCAAAAAAESRRAAAAAAAAAATARRRRARAPRPRAGRILLKGDNITLMMSATAAEASS